MSSLEAIRASLFKIGDDLSAMKITFPPEAIIKSSMETYGKDTGVTDVQRPRVIITTVLADRNPPALHMLCNYGEAKNDQKPPSEWKVWEASIATSAAPILLSPI